MRLTTAVFLRSLGMICLVGLSARADSKQTIPKGTTIAAVAEPAMSAATLGMGFDDKLVAGPRVYPKKFGSAAEVGTGRVFERVDDTLRRDAHAQFLFTKANVKATSAGRYLVVRIAKTARVETLGFDSAAAVTSTAAFYASAIHYGWALYVVIEGTPDTLDEVTAKALEAAAPEKLASELLARKLLARTYAIGMTPKPVVSSVPPIPSYTLSEYDLVKDPQPIYVDYTLLAPVDAVAIDWKPSPKAPADSLDREMITKGVSTAKPAIVACGDHSTVKGVVKVSVRVDGSGNVTNVTIKETVDPALGNCVARAMQRAKFAKTVNGASFSMPFVF